ncbi:hypothetical protein FRC03_010516 [Tulasnella sp. 419]|nr:hypothetical protein FRC03_010516 [Tulasnella sp. 419]
MTLSRLLAVRSSLPRSQALRQTRSSLSSLRSLSNSSSILTSRRINPSSQSISNYTPIFQSRFLSNSSQLATTSSTSAPIQSFQNDEPKLALTFTCTANNELTKNVQCNHRSSHQFTKRAYTKGLVIIQCPSCKNRHLIADHIGWFKETQGTGDGSLKTIEDIMRSRGEDVRKGYGMVGEDGNILEYVLPEGGDIVVEKA